MAEVHPFRALQYDQSVAGPLGELVSPPYDVITPEQREGYLAASDHNAVRLILPQVAYEEVSQLIADWKAAGAIAQAAEPIMVGWTQTFRLNDGSEHTRNTIVATVGLEPYERRVVRPHERTHAGPKEDRLRLTRAVQTNLSPVFSLYPDEVGEVWEAAGGAQQPLGELTDVDGTVHRVWPVDDPAALRAVTEAMADRWVLIADGHHRYETALAYRQERRANGGPDRPMPYDRVMMGLTSLHDPGLLILPTHRVLGEWRPGLAESAFTTTPAENLGDLLRLLEAAPPDQPALGLVTAENAGVLCCPAAPGTSPAEQLDVRVLERDLLVPGFAADQAKLAHDGLLTYTKDAQDAWYRVRSGGAAAAVIIRSMPKNAVAAVAEAGETMPQKSTYFFPKLLTGIAFHALGDG
ncbi:MAG: DUF1015 domain-containing protein [Thermoleophilia bacterium]|nr:DUF1015 domain-containing protein [Thermoleophilia bacterium]